MRLISLTAAALAAIISFAPSGFAGPGKGGHCGPHQKSCVQQSARHHKHAPRQQAGKASKWTRGHHAALRIGDHARTGRAFQRAANSRFKAAPRGQEYRVLNGHLVLVDQKTQRVVAVLGRLTAPSRR